MGFVECVDATCVLSNEYSAKTLAIGATVYKTDDIKRCTPYKCICEEDGTPTVVINQDLIPSPCFQSQAQLTPCEEGKRPCDEEGQCCWSRTCVPNACPDINPVSCSLCEKERLMVDKVVTDEKTG